MKKILFTAVSALALAGFADGVGSTEFGALKVPSSAAQTIVAVPWLESGTGTANVSVSNLVLTAGISDGDTLSLYDPSADGGKGGYTSSWAYSKALGRWVKSGDSADNIPRGSALMLIRSGNDYPLSNGFYIMGKPTNEGGSVTMGKSSTKGVAVFTLIAPPAVTATPVNDLTWGGINGRYDALIIELEDGSSQTLSWNGTAWQTAAGETNVSIPAGIGAWFTSSDYKGTTDKTVTWGTK